MQSRQAIESIQGKCLTCLGTGEVGSINGPVGCGDCEGSGRPPRRHLLTERRIRAIEASMKDDQTQNGIDVTWLAFELRRTREALVKILTLTGGDGLDDRAAQQVWHMANNILGIYEPETLRAEDSKSS